MSDDIIQRLLDAIPHESTDNGMPTKLRQAKVMREAATEIEKQRAENERVWRRYDIKAQILDDRAFLLAKVDRLSLALQTIRDQGGDVVERWSSEVARRALEDRR